MIEVVDVESSRRLRVKRKALEELDSLLKEIALHVSVVVVEGQRDVEALRSLGFEGQIEVCSHVGLSDVELCEIVALDADSVLLLTDFDEEGLLMHNRLKNLLERRGVNVEEGLRREVGRLMAVLGVYAVEDLDNMKLNSGL
jgi:5S rRNA maturation endonuclease (ribonuclease M5)